MTSSRYKFKTFLCYFMICFLIGGIIFLASSDDGASNKSTANMFESIQVIHHPSQAQLKELNVSDWPTWRKEISEFTWYFGEEETAYILEGEVIVRPEGVPESEGVLLQKGDLVTFSAGLISQWVVKKEVYKHYSHKKSFLGASYWWAVFKLKAAKRRLDRFL